MAGSYDFQYHHHHPGNSAGDLFGMVKTLPLQRLSDLQRLGIRRSRIESPGSSLGGGFKHFLFSTLFGKDSHFD